MPAKKKSTAPADLSDAGRAVWDSIASRYALRPDEVARLHAACRTADMVASLEAAWSERGCPMITTGSMGQEVIHPLIGELRAQRSALDGALTRLKLPDDEGGGVAVNQQRDAANSKWSTGRGRGA
ncbi:hypothetical protein [Nocardioides terrisoli]|uniref:hypothetical protein n=1 Tax=Nocardioides terrisoli TaxID=3388267 RepID=UPI00287B749A|nr:hypothetical protein [Nocardioides marmorisolisilvae]